MSKDIKIAMIGGGGKNIGGTIFYLLNSKRLRNVEFALFGRTQANMDRNIEMAKKIKDWQGCSIIVYDSLDKVLSGADIVMHCATPGNGEYAGFKSFGIPHGAHIMHVGEKVSKICPNAWFLGAVNPPEVVMSALLKRYGLFKTIGLCNAPMIIKKTLSAVMGINENEVIMRGTGMNHDVWYYDFKLGDISDNKKIVEIFRKHIDDPGLNDHEWFRLFPEWKIAILNNIEVLNQTGYLFSPAGGTKRMKGLPVSGKDYGAVMKRPSKEDFEKCLDDSVSCEQMLRITGRCGGGVPGYTGRIMESIILSDNIEHSALVPNLGQYKDAPDNIHVQADVTFENNGVKIHGAAKLPPFIKGMLTARFIQNDMLTSAMAFQDEDLLKKAILIIPERHSFDEALTFNAAGDKSVEPMIPFN